MQYIYDIKSELLLVRKNDFSLHKWSVGTAHLRTVEQSCKRASFWTPKPAQPRTQLDFVIDFEDQFRPESKIYRVSWGMCNCGVAKT